MEIKQEFTQTVINQAWNRAQGRCECTENCHSIFNRCNKILDPKNNEIGKKWHAHHINSNGESILSNCKILCIPCHQNTRSFGR